MIAVFYFIYRQSLEDAENDIDVLESKLEKVGLKEAHSLIISTILDRK